MNMRNDVARGGELVGELLRITGEAELAEEIEKLDELMVEETMSGLDQLQLGGEAARSQNLDVIKAFSLGES
jgi:hypothetical protein